METCQVLLLIVACMDMKHGRKAFRGKPTSSNLTGLTKANANLIGCMDIKLSTQYLHGDLSGFIIYYRLHGYGLWYV
jgi:hypothetical protein